MELETQKFLRGGGTPAELQAAYGIKSKVNDALGIVALNYNQIASPMHEQICQECRALILDTQGWSVASRSFSKFFNHGEPNAHAIDWTMARVQEKIDGSLICFYAYRDEWQVATKGTPDASGPVNTWGFTFRALVERALGEMGSSFDDFTARLNPDFFYSFELTAPENRIIIPYTERRLTWLAAWDRNTLEEQDIGAMPDLPTPRVKEYPLQTLDEVMDAVAAITPFAAEGFIVRDGQCRRVKIKSAAYLMIDRVLCSLSTPRRKVEAVLSDGFDDMIPHLPNSVREELFGIRAQIAEFRAGVGATFESLREIQERRLFAAEALKQPYSAMLFWLYGGLDMDECFRKLHPDRLVEWLNLTPGTAPDEGGE